MTEWISVKDNLPEETQLVLIFGDDDCDGDVWCAMYDADSKEFDSLEQDRCEEHWIWDTVTHWALIPEGPKEKDKNKEHWECDTVTHWARLTD